MTCDSWHDTWHSTEGIWEVTSDSWHDRWHLTGGIWEVIFDKWNVTDNILQVKFVKWRSKGDILQLTCVRSHVTDENWYEKFDKLFLKIIEGAQYTINVVPISINCCISAYKFSLLLSGLMNRYNLFFYNFFLELIILSYE